VSNLQKFCLLIRNRSKEHRKSILVLEKEGLYGQTISILRQELDSMIRVLFLLTQDVKTRNELMELTLNGDEWRLGKSRVTDRAMVNASQKMHGWANSVYKFGCAFIHLSSFHNYLELDPFLNLEKEEMESIKQHMIHYHFYPPSDNITMNSLYPYILSIFEKIERSLERYLENLESEKTEEIWGIA